MTNGTWPVILGGTFGPMILGGVFLRSLMLLYAATVNEYSTSTVDINTT